MHYDVMKTWKKLKYTLLSEKKTILPIELYNTKSDPNVNYGLWLEIIYQY